MIAPARRRRFLRVALGSLAGAAGLAGCAGIGSEPVRVTVAGIDALEGQGLEVRLALQLRVQNPNARALAYEGISLQLDLRGTPFASGVSPAAGAVPPFGEAVVTVPVTVSAVAMLRQAIGLASGDRSRISFRLRGRLARAGFDGFGLMDGVSFESAGEVDLPAALGSLGG